jgi:hypothetical protein
MNTVHIVVIFVTVILWLILVHPPVDKKQLPYVVGGIEIPWELIGNACITCDGQLYFKDSPSPILNMDKQCSY